MPNATVESVCTSCAQSAFLPEIPGQFRDFDADSDLHGTVGVPLCSGCLGTGRRIENAEFLSLREEVSRIRNSNLGIQMKASENKNWRIEVKANNHRLIEIAKRALEMVTQPDKNCLAMKLHKGEES